MAYGQTGSGKTHTLMAPDGITAGVIERCFKRITQDDLHDYKVTMSYLQIYQEKIYDLLNSTNKVELSLREHPVKGVYVENLSEFVVRSPVEVLSLLAVGRKRLVFAETKMNRNSSRSHSVCQLKIERTLNKSKAQSQAASSQDREEMTTDDDKSIEDLEGGTEVDEPETDEGGKGAEAEDESLTKMVAFNDDVLIRGRIYLCDLAGSERLKKTMAEGERLCEAQHINSSLLELGNVIQALAEGRKTHVPFRNSTLTRLLQESLGGNCKTSLVVCVSPTMSDVSETKSSLYFGSRAMKITNTAYVNVEVDYKKLSEDLSKAVDLKDRDLEVLKESYEHRLEQIKQDAEKRVANAMAEAERAMAAVKSQYEDQLSSLKRDLESLNVSFENEKAQKESLQGELTVATSKLQEDQFRGRTALLMDLISMQLLYSIKELSLDDSSVAAIQVKSEDLKDALSLKTKTQILENADLLVELFKRYFNIMTTKSAKALENSEDLRFFLGPVEQLPLCDAEDLSLYSTNKTDDDKAIASSRSHETTCDEGVVLLNGEKLQENDKCIDLREKLISVKNSVDGKALDYLKKVFEFDSENNGLVKDRKRVVYEMVQELLQRRESVVEIQNSQNLPSLVNTLALLDNCHSHVIIDKALQSAILVLENDVISRRYNDIQKQKNKLENENETLRKEIQTLKSEAEKLNGKLDETSSMLTVVAKGKEKLEDDLCSVFQLHNMICERKTEKDLQADNNAIPENVASRSATLAEDSEALKDEKEKKQEQSEIPSVKNKLSEEIPQYPKDHQNDKYEQSENSQQAASSDLVDGELSAKSVQDKETFQEMLSFFQEDYSFSLENAASTAEINEAVDVSSLKAAINKRLGDEWSLVVIENARLKTELENIRSRINEEKTTVGKEFTKLKGEEASSLAEKSSFTKGEEPGRTIGADRLEIIVYEQNKIIAKLEMDKQDFMKRLQRNREDNAADCKSQNARENCHDLTKDDFATVLREQLNHFLVQKGEDLRRDKCGTLEKGCEDCHKTKEMLKKTVENFEVEITKTRDRCCDLDQQLIQCTIEKSNLKANVEMLKCELLEARKAMDVLEEPKIAREETLHQREEIVNREIALVKEKNAILEKNLQEETEKLEEQRRLLQEKEKELTEVKENYKELQRGVNEYKEERDNMIKEINSLRCLKNLPIINNTFNNKEEVLLLQNPPLFDSGAKRSPNRKNSRLNSELTRAKEQLVKLKAELTMSNIQTKNLGTQLSSLREDSTKLEAELSTVRVSPKNSRQRRNSFSYYDETVRLGVELGEAKERIIDLQEKLLDIYKEKFALEERILSLEGDSEPKDEACAVQNAALGTEPCSTENSRDGGEVQKMSLDHVKLFENKVHLLEAEKAQLQQNLENTNADKNRLEGLEFYLRQLITLDEEQLRLKNKLKILATSDELHNSEPNQETDSSTRRNNWRRIMENDFCIELRELTGENFALQEEAYILKETIVDLQNGLAALKLKLSMKESVHEATRDRRAAASLLVSTRQERAELKNALDVALVEKDDLEEELAQMKMKYNKLQRELAMTSMVKDDLELEIVSLKSKKRGSLDLERYKEQCSDVLPGAIEDLIFYNDSAVKGYLQEHATKTNDAAVTAMMGESLVSSTKSRSNERKSVLPRPTNLQGLNSSKKKASKQQILCDTNEEKVSVNHPRLNRYHEDQPATNDTMAITYDLIRIDDGNDGNDITDYSNCTCSGLLREAPKGEREKPEGMEQDEGMLDLTTDSSEDGEAVNDTVRFQDEHGSFHDNVTSESIVSQSEEVQVKTPWSLKSLFRRQKSFSLPDHDLGALKQ
ncbi:kinesin-like protein KIN-7O isoform X2 [Acropora millepora]|nr:kinesin-like protein KIN-7O isoform X2 [Acropora millepora]